MASVTQLLKSVGYSEQVVAVDNGLIVDLSYQRGPQDKFIREQVARGFDLARAGFIVVNRRKSGVEAIVDGQQRWHIARGCGEKDMLARISEGLTIEQEAELHYALNVDVKGQTKPDKFKSAYRAGHPDARAIYDVVHSFGSRIYGVDGKAGDTLTAIGAMENVYAQGGSEALATTFNLLRDAFGDLSRQTTQAGLLSGAYMAFAWHPEIDRKRLAKRLGEEGAVLLRTKAAAFMHGSPNPRGFYLAAIEAYNLRLHDDNRVDPRSRKPRDE